MNFTFTPITPVRGERTNDESPLADDLPVAKDAGSEQTEVDGKSLKKSAQNLLVHIPGEASGFYLMCMSFLSSNNVGDTSNNANTAVEIAQKGNEPSIVMAIVVAVFALIVLIVVRWAAGASKAVIVTSVVAFFIWMLALDNGVLNLYFTGLNPGIGLMLAAFYSIIVTTLANAGKIK